MIFQKNGFIKKHFDKISIFIYFCTVYLIFILRDPSYFSDGFLWAEDANIFLSRSMHDGIASFVKPYNGYYHFFPQLITYLCFSFCKLFNCMYFLPLLMVYCSTAISVCCIFPFVKNEFEWLISSRFLRCLVICLCITFMPALTQEVWYSVAAFQWWAQIYIFLFGLDLLKNRGEPSLITMIVLFLIGLSTPSIFLLLPIYCLYFILEWHSNRLSLKNFIFPLILLLPICLQLFTSIATGRSQANIVQTIQLIIDFFVKVWPSSIVSINIIEIKEQSLLVFFIFYLSTFLLIWCNKKTRALWGYGFLYIALSIFMPAYSLSNEEYLWNAGRYCMIPVFVWLFLCFITLVEFFISPIFNRSFHSITTVFTLFIVCSTILSSITNIRYHTTKPQLWKTAIQYYSEDGAAQRCWVEIEPGDPWGIEVPIELENSLEQTELNRFKFNIESIGDFLYANIDDGVQIENDTSSLALKGWAFDSKNKLSTYAVFCKCNGVMIPANKIDRPDVTSSFDLTDNESYDFTINIPKSYLFDGENQLSLIFVNAENNCYAEYPFSLSVDLIP